jgi:hypothetical protein
VLILRFSRAQEISPDPDRDAPADGRPAEPSPDASG